MVASPSDVAVDPRPGSAPSHRLAALLRAERPFAIAVGLAVLVRVLVQVAFPPAFIYSDAPTYLGLVDDLSPSPDRPVGYGVLLQVLSWLTRGVDAVAITQHLIGLVTAGILYALLRRWGVSPRLATLAAVPLLFDGMQLVLEHSVLSDVLFELLLVAGVAALAWWRRPRLATTALAGVLLGCATLVRVVGEPAVLAAVVFCVVAASGLRTRILHAVVVALAFAAPLVSYAAWYHHDEGAWAITQTGGRALYMRTTAFVDCTKFSMPSYERTLCPAEPVGQRLDPTEYGWHLETTVRSLKPPPGVSEDQALKDFAMRAIRAQPLDYARVVGRDFAMGFVAPVRNDYFEYDTAYKWSFSHYVDYTPTPDWTRPAYAAHDGQMPSTLHPVADVLSAYGYVVYLPGPLALVLVVVAVGGLVVRRPRDAPPTRPLTFLTLALALGLVAVPDLTAEFTWRYQLPVLVLLPASAALAWTRLRGPAAADRSSARSVTADGPSETR